MADEQDTNPELTKLAQSLMPFTRQLGLEVLEGAPQRVVARVVLVLPAAQRAGPFGDLHGIKRRFFHVRKIVAEIILIKPSDGLLAGRTFV